ncbi:hypothetical protein Poly24_52020 [Rosistilla carotiformis]|uniref:Tetratricopeptide repeat protein n=1 Tax=Rosistilla carotiformis TaxID=2528017 RepID=A0A518K0Z3_9BACT|nr:tetratricopeptide repeat protein [Rosistilla carotiformis]QDV71466.1 hypothetical protein Poly24_52020 [Rosistilla carotiformis]
MSARHKTNQTKKNPRGAEKSPHASQPVQSPPGYKHQALHRVASLIQQSDYGEAVEVLRAAGYDNQVRNALGVCLMRLGRSEEAVAVFRQFVLSADGVSEKREICNAYKRNFATALLLKGTPSGALSVLRDTREPEHPMAVCISTAIRNWADSLPWWPRINWKINLLEPANCHVPIDFEPGELDFEIDLRKPTGPSNGTYGLAV